MRNAILLGDYEDIKYHPLNGIDKEIKCILRGLVEVTVVSNYGELTLNELKKYDMLIDYIDNWQDKGTEKLAATIVTYVAQGGTLFSIHNGIIKGSNYELSSLQGGIMLMHPPYTAISYNIVGTHIIGSGFDKLEMYLEEEPYMFDIDPFANSDVFLSYTYGNLEKPAGWTRKFAKGRVCYIAPGHNIITYKNETFRQLIRKCSLWACGELGNKHGGVK